MDVVPFNRPFITGTELSHIQEAIRRAHLSGNGFFTKRCHRWLEQKIGSPKALLTHSGTAALEMAALLIDIQPGDEVILPSFTFPSTANAFVLRGGVPVFVDIRPDTLNLDETKIESAITNRTKAIVAVHYAGIACEMDTIVAIARKHRLIVVEDAAQGILSSYKGHPLGSFGHLSALSFHETKVLGSGEGGALLINDPAYHNRAEFIWEKGTNRAQFFRGQVDKYTWVDIGSSYLPSEITASFLWAQCERADSIVQSRLKLWHQYHTAFEDPEKSGKIRRPIVPSTCMHNGMTYYLLASHAEHRTELLERLRALGIDAVFHYLPLHSSPAGRKYGRVHGAMTETERASQCVVRLPLWVGMREQEVLRVCSAVREALQLPTLEVSEHHER